METSSQITPVCAKLTKTNNNNIPDSAILDYKGFSLVQFSFVFYTVQQRAEDLEDDF